MENNTAPKLSILHIQDHTGDTQIQWNPQDAVSVAVAAGVFNARLREGRAAFALDSAGGGSQIDSFDEKAEKIIMIKQLKGG